VISAFSRRLWKSRSISSHQWGEWTYKELYVNAKQATLNARRQIWNCRVDDAQKDGYGRILAVCLDLGIDHLKKGYAHAYSIDKPADWRLIQAQREAIVKRRGMWAKGVPPQVLTSLHSADERPFNKKNYNRLISPLDGWSESTRSARSWAALPATAVKYIRRIEELIEAPVALLSTSPERDDTVLVRDPFED